MSESTPIILIPVKRGWQTTEFWLAVAGNAVTILGTLLEMVPRETAPWVFGAINVAYMLSRAVTKAFAAGEMLPAQARPGAVVQPVPLAPEAVPTPAPRIHMEGQP